VCFYLVWLDARLRAKLAVCITSADYFAFDRESYQYPSSRFLPILRKPYVEESVYTHGHPYRHAASRSYRVSRVKVRVSSQASHVYLPGMDIA